MPENFSAELPMGPFFNFRGPGQYFAARKGPALVRTKRDTGEGSGTN